MLRALGLGLITGAADDDCSAIGTYASAGAKLGQVAGQGLFAVMRDHYPRWLLYATLVGVMIGNTMKPRLTWEGWLRP